MELPMLKSVSPIAELKSRASAGFPTLAIGVPRRAALLCQIPNRPRQEVTSLFYMKMTVFTRVCFWGLIFSRYERFRKEFINISIFLFIFYFRVLTRIVGNTKSQNLIFP